MMALELPLLLFCLAGAAFFAGALFAGAFLAAGVFVPAADPFRLFRNAAIRSMTLVSSGSATSTTPLPPLDLALIIARRASS